MNEVSIKMEDKIWNPSLLDNACRDMAISSSWLYEVELDEIRMRKLVKEILPAVPVLSCSLLILASFLVVGKQNCICVSRRCFLAIFSSILRYQRIIRCDVILYEIAEHLIQQNHRLYMRHGIIEKQKMLKLDKIVYKRTRVIHIE